MKIAEEGRVTRESERASERERERERVEETERLHCRERERESSSTSGLLHARGAHTHTHALSSVTTTERREAGVTWLERRGWRCNYISPATTTTALATTPMTTMEADAGRLSDNGCAVKRVDVKTRCVCGVVVLATCSDPRCTQAFVSVMPRTMGQCA